jgi:hypothetical protein
MKKRTVGSKFTTETAWGGEEEFTGKNGVHWKELGTLLPIQSRVCTTAASFMLSNKRAGLL